MSLHLGFIMLLFLNELTNILFLLVDLAIIYYKKPGYSVDQIIFLFEDLLLLHLIILLLTFF